MVAKGTVTYIDGRRIVLDEDGKPCRSCNSLLDFQAVTKGSSNSTNSTSSFPSFTKKSTAATTATTIAATEGMTTDDNSTVPKTKSGYAKDCPPDAQALGRATWTFLHTMASKYPEKATAEDQADMKSFFTVFSKHYPCWYCAADFRKWMAKPGNEPKLEGKDEFGNWLCDAHNAVNKKLGKPKFNCKEWKARWKDAWNDGRC